MSLGWVSPGFTSTANAALCKALLLERTDVKQLPSTYPAFALHHTVNCLQKPQDNLRGVPNWQPQPSQAEHSLRAETVISAKEQKDLSPHVNGAAQPDASQPTPVGAAAMPAVGVGGLKSTSLTTTPTKYVGAAPQQVNAALEGMLQSAPSQDDAPNMRRPAASGMSHQAAAHMLPQEAPAPDGSAPPGRWRSKYRPALQTTCSRQAASAASLQRIEGACSAEDQVKPLQGSGNRAQHYSAAAGVAAVPGSGHCAVEDTSQAEDTPSWLFEQVTAPALMNVMAENCHKPGIE